MQNLRAAATATMDLSKEEQIMQLIRLRRGQIEDFVDNSGIHEYSHDATQLRPRHEGAKAPKYKLRKAPEKTS